jgi:O-succinylbenzoate synthase
MKIWIHKYQLNPADRRFKPRVGALVKAEWALSQTGYSDLHPWPEFGEAPLDEHIESLRKVAFTPLAENSLEFNYIDREYRLTKRNAFAGLIPPRSHRLVTDLRKTDAKALSEWHKAGYTHLKVKMGDDLSAETDLLVQLVYASPLMWRIDLNGKLNASDFTAWWKSLGEDVKARIDFIEDPTGGEQLKIAGPWANDWKIQERAQIRILKPAR